MPMPGNKTWFFTPKDVNSLSQMNYTYDNLNLTPVVNLLAQRMGQLGQAAPAAAAGAAPGRTTVELVGSNETALPIKGASTSTTVKLDTAGSEQGFREPRGGSRFGRRPTASISISRTCAAHGTPPHSVSSSIFPRARIPPTTPSCWPERSDSSGSGGPRWPADSTSAAG